MKMCVWLVHLWIVYFIHDISHLIGGLVNRLHIILFCPFFSSPENRWIEGWRVLYSDVFLYMRVKTKSLDFRNDIAIRSKRQRQLELWARRVTFLSQKGENFFFFFLPLPGPVLCIFSSPTICLVWFSP